EVLGGIDERIVVVGAVAVEADIGSALIETRGLDGGDPARPRQADLVRDVHPLLAAVARHPEGAVVGAGPEGVGVGRRLGQGGATTLVGARDLRRDDAQVIAAVERTEDEVAGAVVDARVVMGENERRVPVPAVARGPLTPAPLPPAGRGGRRPRADRCLFAGAQIA